MEKMLDAWTLLGLLFGRRRAKASPAIASAQAEPELVLYWGVANRMAHPETPQVRMIAARAFTALADGETWGAALAKQGYRVEVYRWRCDAQDAANLANGLRIRHCPDRADVVMAFAPELHGARPIRVG